MSVLSKATYKPLSLVSGMIGGALAGALFTRIWRALADADEAPEPTALDHRTREVLIAAALHGAVFGLVKAAVDRTTAKGYRRLTGTTRSAEPSCPGLDRTAERHHGAQASRARSSGSSRGLARNGAVSWSTSGN
ncbi:MAG: DUF4235 domain-containing protein [Pseudonocardiaceae bacterium]